MGKHWLHSLRKELMASCAALAVAGGSAGLAQAQNAAAPTETATLQQQLEAQQRQIDELKKMIQMGASPPAPVALPQPGGLPSEVRLIQGGMQSGQDLAGPGPVNTDQPALPTKVDSAGKTDGKYKLGYDPSKGMYFDAALDPEYPITEDGKYPFELRIRGRIQADYYGYKVTDSKNHLTGIVGSANDAPDESLLEVKRMRLIFAGYMFDPNLRYQIQFDGNTRGLSTELTGQNSLNGVPAKISGAAPGVNGSTSAPGTYNNGTNISSVDSGVRLLEAWVAYDFHGDAGAYGYRPTYSIIAGKFKPFGSFEEYLGSANGQFVEFGMSSWMFDSDADNYLPQAGVQIHALDDRLFVMATITSGPDNQVPDYNLDNIPGGIIGFWYDFGGTFDPKTERWKLYGESISDIEQHEDPVLRVGGTAVLDPMGRRSQYTSAKLDFFKAATSAPGGSNVDSVLGGGGLGTAGNFSGVSAGNSPFAVDAFDVYTYNLYYAFKYEGFSFYNEWWIRDYDNFRGEKNSANNGNGNYPILYTTNSISGGTAAALFNKADLVDFGSAFQTGYFLIPHKLEIAARWDFISGVSGDINGNGTYSTVSSTALGIKQAAAVNGVQPANTVPLNTNIRIVNGAFTHLNMSNEIALGVNVFFYGEKVKWQTDIDFYTGGNPASNGQSPAGYIVGVDGYMVRTQVQFSF